eukprot:93538-Karenia_brevis.AAC.1
MSLEHMVLQLGPAGERLIEKAIAHQNEQFFQQQQSQDLRTLEAMDRQAVTNYVLSMDDPRHTMTFMTNLDESGITIG